MPNPPPNTRVPRGHINGQWVFSTVAGGLTVGGSIGACLKVGDLLRIDCKVGDIVIIKFVLLIITFLWLLYVILSTGPAYKVFRYLDRVPRKVFVVVTCTFAVLWMAMTLYASAECNETCAQCPKLAFDPNLGVQILWGIAGTVCTCKVVQGPGKPGYSGLPKFPHNRLPTLEWRADVGPEIIGQLINNLHQYGIDVVLIICLASAAWLSESEWDSTGQDSNSSPDVADVENGEEPVEEPAEQEIQHPAEQQDNEDNYELATGVNRGTISRSTTIRDETNHSLG